MRILNQTYDLLLNRVNSIIIVEESVEQLKKNAETFLNVNRITQEEYNSILQIINEYEVLQIQ